MPLYETLDLFLSDIPGPAPEGKDLKYDIEYDQIKEGAREDLDLPQGVWVQDLKSANWTEVEKICIDILQNKSKDLQVAAWLIEAWLSLYNIQGLKQGFNLLLQLSQKYWDTAFPKLSPQDPEFRASPYNWINEKLSERFNKIEVTAPEDGDLFAYSYSTYIDIQKDGGIGIVSSTPKEDRSFDDHREDFQKSLNKTKDDFFKTFKKEGEETLKIMKDLGAFLDTKLGPDGASLFHAEEKIKELISFSDQVMFSRQKPEEEVDVKLESNLSSSAPPSDVSPPLNTNVHVDMVINSRSEAYTIINKAADYLEKLDPHSPSPHLIKRAIRWSNLDLKELLQEMVKDPNSLDDLKHLLGMTQEGEASLEKDQPEKP